MTTPASRLGGLSKTSSASVGLADYSQVDKLGVWYKSVSFRADKSRGPPNWRVSIDWYSTERIGGR